MTPVLRLARTLLAALLMTMAAAAAAQDARGDAFADWEALAQRAEAAIDADAASLPALESLRTELAGARQRFLDATDVNADRIETLQSQLAALGPPPAEGETEAPDIAARRAELNEQLVALRAPVLAAEEAYNRADGLIGELDRIVRERQTEALLSLGPSPLNPALWVPALSELRDVARDLAQEVEAGVRNPTRRAELRGNMPLVLVLLLGAAVLLVRGRLWSERIGERLSRLGGQANEVWRFLVSLLRIALPVAGLLLLTEAVRATAMLGAFGLSVLEAIPLWGAVILYFRWLSERLFAKSDDETIFLLSAERRREARLYGPALALLFVLRGALGLMGELEDVSTASLAVLAFPAVVLSALVLFRLGQILTDPQAPEQPAGGGGGVPRARRLSGRAAMVVAFVAPVMAGIGYGAAGNALLYPFVMTLVLGGTVLVLQRFFTMLYGWTSGMGAAARDALVPVLIGFVLGLLALPPLALIWGARVADLTEILARFSEGFVMGETRISPGDFLTFAIVFAGGFVLTRLLQGALRSNVLPKTSIDPGGRTAIVSGLGYLGIFLAAIVAITAAGIDLSALAVVAGALSVGIGFGLQNIVQNFVSGIILLIERPISEGDWVEVNGQMGYVRSISVRSTRIETFDRTDVIVPNGDFISGSVTNYTRGNTVGRAIVPVGVAYGTDTRRVERILTEIAESHPMVLLSPPPAVIFQGFGADSLDFEIRAILRDVNFLLSVRTELNHLIAERFKAEGIEIPFAQRDVWLRNPETLRGAAPEEEAG